MGDLALGASTLKVRRSRARPPVIASVTKQSTRTSGGLRPLRRHSPSKDGASCGALSLLAMTATVSPTVLWCRANAPGPPLFGLPPSCGACPPARRRFIQTHAKSGPHPAKPGQNPAKEILGFPLAELSPIKALRRPPRAFGPFLFLRRFPLKGGRGRSRVIPNGRKADDRETISRIRLTWSDFGFPVRPAVCRE